MSGWYTLDHLTWEAIWGENVSEFSSISWVSRRLPPNIGEVSFTTNRVLKTEPVPVKYSSDAQLMEDMLFLKYNKTTEISWYNLKGIIRPEKVAMLFYHWSYFQFEGVNVVSVPKRFGHVRWILFFAMIEKFTDLLIFNVSKYVSIFWEIIDFYLEKLLNFQKKLFDLPKKYKYHIKLSF